MLINGLELKEKLLKLRNQSIQDEIKSNSITAKVIEQSYRLGLEKISLEIDKLLIKSAQESLNQLEQ